MSVVATHAMPMLFVRTYQVLSHVHVVMATVEMDSAVEVRITLYKPCNTRCYMCLDIDECGSSPCDVNAACQNIPGSFMCTCNTGYAGDGFTCHEGRQSLWFVACIVVVIVV